jgi:ATP dependent DNA ligase domain
VIYPELLQDATDQMVQTLMLDRNWVWQEKHNGDRRIVEKSYDSKLGFQIIDWNRNAGRGKGLTPNLIAALKKHPLHQFVIDCEFVSDKLFVFDALHLGDHVVVNEKYRTRLEYLHAAFDGFNKDIETIQSVITPEDKLALYERLQTEHAEGFVMKDLNAKYRPSNQGGSLRFNFRRKFAKTLDAVVIGDSQERDDKGMLKNSVRLGLYMPNGFLKDICGATKKSAFVLKAGDVVELKYLYGTGTLDVVQPRILRLRDDKIAQNCTIDQIVVNKNWRKK